MGTIRKKSADRLQLSQLLLTLSSTGIDGALCRADLRDLISQKMKVVKIPILEHHSRDTITQKGSDFPFRALHIDVLGHYFV